MRVFDCFLFFNELDLLEIRLELLNDHVDYFVIVESDITFQGDKKEYVLEKNLHRFKKFLNKIHYYKIPSYSVNFNSLPYVVNPNNRDDYTLNLIYSFIEECKFFNKEKEFWWGNDFYQRECIRRALDHFDLQDNDLVLISDLDEIPNPNILINLQKLITKDHIYCLRQHEFCYYLNYFHCSNWIGTSCFQYANFSKTSINSIRFCAKRDEGIPYEIIDDAGWHFTSLGGVESVISKIESWGHRELNKKFVLKSVKYNILHGCDIFRRQGFGKLTYLDRNNQLLPLDIDYSKYRHLLGPKIKREKFYKKYFLDFYFRFSNKFYQYLKSAK